MGNSIDHGMFRKSVLLAFGLSISFSGFALAASEEPVPEQQAQAVEGARKINPAAVEVLLDNNRRMTLDFYGDNVFRIFRDDRGGIIRDPKAEPEARILADSPRGRFPGWMWTSRAMRLSSLRGRSGLR